MKDFITVQNEYSDILGEASGKTFNAILLYPGDTFPNGIAMKHKEPVVGFYDATHQTPEAPYGHIAATYYAKTIMANQSGFTLDLHGGVPSWKVSAASMDCILNWLGHYIVDGEWESPNKEQTS